MTLIRLLITAARNSRVEAGLALMPYRRCKAEVIETDDKPFVKVSADFDLGRFDAEGDHYVCEMLQCVQADIISIARED
jgi:hypothetical protein